ncbi:MAG TPA: hypothetical protein VNC61_01050 [Acidimicrobiales bacterium]|nr:hypothetical protein [Acidimicrobiales bacterium]
MAEDTRRSFLRNSGLAVAAADAADATPVGTAEGTATMTEPLVAHVPDLSTGDIGIFNGTREG